MVKLGIGVIGTGIMAKTHAAITASYHRSELVAWSARSAASAKKLDERLGADVVVGVDALLERDDVHALIIATPDHAHADAAVAAIEAGKHVLIEKPLATTSADARRIRDSAIAAGVKVTTLFNHRWVPAYWQARTLTQDAQMGRPTLAYARKNDTIFVPTEMISWADQTTPSFFLSSHDLDLILWYFQDHVVVVFETAVHGVLSGQGIDTPDAVVAQLRLAEGAVVTLEACWNLPNSFPTMTDSFIELIFENGAVRLDRISEQISVATPAGYSYPRNQLSSRVGGRHTGSVSLAIQDFVDAVLDDRPPLISLESSVHVTDVLVAIDKSWRTGTPVALNS